MRYNTPIFFEAHAPGAYNEETGNYSGEGVSTTKRYASVMDTQTQTLNIVYGEIRQGSLTIQIQQPFLGAYDLIRVGEKRYRTDYSRNLRDKQVFIVSEVQ